MRTRQLTQAAMLAALSAVAGSLPANVFKFTGFPVILAGLALGPWGGALVGGVSDVLGYMLHGSGPYHPGFTLTQALTGFLPPLLLGRRRPTLLRLLAVLAVTQGLTKGFLVPALYAHVFGAPFQAVQAKMLLEQALHVPLYAWAAVVLLRALETSGQVFPWTPAGRPGDPGSPGLNRSEEPPQD